MPSWGERLPLECLQQNVDGLVEALPALVECVTEAVELVALIATAQADIKPAAAQEVGGGDLLEDDQGMVQRQHDDGGADTDPFGVGREVHREHQRTRQVAVRREVMLGAPDAVEAQPVGGLSHLGRSREHLDRVLRAW